MNNVIPILIMSAMFVGGTGLFYTAPAEAPMVPQTQAQIFDREDCQQQCSFDYGFDLQRFRGGRSGSNSAWIHAYYRCLERCDDKYWKSFDNEMDDLDRE